MASKDLFFNLFGRDVNATSEMRKVAVVAEEQANRIKKTYGVLPGIAAAAVAGSAGIAIKMAADFQQLTTRLVTDAGESAANLTKVRAGILDISTATGTSAKEVADGMYTVESAGYHGAAGIQVMRAAAEAAKIGMADMHTTADALTTVMKDYSLPAATAADTTSKLIATVSVGKTTMEALAGSLHSVLPNAAAAGIGLQEVLGAVGTMTQEGISADQATQNLNHAILSLVNPTHVQTQEMAAMGLSSVEVAKNLGKNGLTGTLEQLEQAVLTHMGKSGLVMQSAFNTSKIAAQSAEQELTKLPKSLQGLAREFLNNQITQKEWTKALKGQDVLTANLGKQFATTAKHAHGFSDMLKSGGGTAQTFLAAMDKMTGGMTGLQVAMHLTGEHMSDFKANVHTVGAATAEAGGHVRGWAETQHNFNQQLSQAVEGIKNLGIGFGSFLLPGLTDTVKVFNGFAIGIRDGNGGAIALAATIGIVVGGLAAAWVAMKAYTLASDVAKASQLILGGIQKVNTAITVAHSIAVTGDTAALSGQTLGTKLAAAAMMLFNGTLFRSVAAMVASKVETLALTAMYAKDFAVAVARSVAAFVAQAAQVTLSTGAMIAQRTVMVIGTVVTWAAAAATTAFGIAMNVATGPIGLVILAVAALIAGIILLVTHWKDVCAFIQTVWGAVAKWFGDTLNSIGKWWNDTWAAVVHTVQNVLGWVGHNWPLILGIITGPIGLAVLYVVTHWSQILTVVQTVIGQVRAFFAGAAGWLLDAGRHIIEGLIHGVMNSVGLATNAIRTVASGVIDTFKNVLGIKSPSKVFAQIGTWIGTGLVQGLAGTSPQVHQAVTDLGAKVVAGFTAMAAQREAAQTKINALNRRLATTIANRPELTPNARGRVTAAREESYERAVRTWQARVAALRTQRSAEQEVLRGLMSPARARSAQSGLTTLIAADNAQLTALAAQRTDLTADLKTADQALKTALQAWTQTKDQAAKAALQGGDPVTALTAYDQAVKAGTTMATPGGGYAAMRTAVQNQLTKVLKFRDDLKQLAADGIDPATYAQLVQAGISGGGLEAADTLLAQGSAGIAEMTGLQTQLKTASDALGINVADQMNGAGVHAAQGLVDGLNSQLGAVQAAMDKIANSMVAAVRKTLGIASPSTVLREHGRWAGDGLVLGIRDRQSDAEHAMTTLVTLGNPAGRVATAPGTVGLPGQIPTGDGQQRPLVHIDHFHTTPGQSPAAIAADLGWLARGGL